MIGLFGHDELSTIGIAAVLDVEKIPYRRLSRIEDCNGALLLVTAADLTPAELAAIARQPALVMNGGPLFARHMFGAANPTVRAQRCVISLEESIWPRRVTECARYCGKSVLRIPRAPVCEIAAISRGTVLAEREPAEPDEHTRRPAIICVDDCVWSLVDLGSAFASLLNETYLPEPAARVPAGVRAWSQRLAEGAYYQAPQAVRTWIQRQCYSRLESRLATGSEHTSEYPVDAAGWLLIELVKTLVRLAAGWVVRLERWPAPFRAAATLTHDIEPTRYAYTTGLGRLLSVFSDHSPALGLVAEASARYLSDAVVRRLRDHEIVCHGLAHRGEIVHGRTRVTQRVHTARIRLERRLGRPVRGYRSPRLDRSPDLAWALDQNGFAYDSSYPDVDRENSRHFGAGVCLNVPYRPLVHDESGRLCPSRCLELPLTAPDCIQPLFAGQTLATLRADVAAKAAFLRETGGVYVALVHAGVFGDQDAALREEHVAFVCQQLRHPDTWLAGMDQIADWWCRREALRLSLRDNNMHLINEGQQPVASVRLVFEYNAGTTTVAVPALQPGARTTIALAPFSRSSPRYLRCA